MPPVASLRTTTHATSRTSNDATRAAHASTSRASDAVPLSSDAAPSERFEGRAPRSDSARRAVLGDTSSSTGGVSFRRGAPRTGLALLRPDDATLRDRVVTGLKMALAGLAFLGGAHVAKADTTVPGATTTVVEQPLRPQSPLGLRIHELRGSAIAVDKVARTPSHELRLTSHVDGRVVPDLHLTQRTIRDPAPRASVVDAAKASSIRSADDVRALVAAELAANAGWLKPEKDALLAALPEADRSAYAWLNVRGQRAAQLFTELERVVHASGLQGEQRDAALQAVNLAKADVLRGDRVEFDPSDTGSYWSYGKDAPFVKVYERLLASLPDGAPEAKALQAQIDFIFTHKYVESGSVDEDDAEKSMGLVAIDRDTRAKASMAKGSEHGNFARYVTLSLTADDGGVRSVFREKVDGVEKHFFEGTRDELTPAQVAKLVEKPVTDGVVFRRAKEGEQLRAGFRYDWDRNGRLDAEKINTGWWGHCDTRALMEAALLDMKGSGGVKEYRSDSGKTTDYTRDHQLEALASLLNINDRYVDPQGARGAWMFGQYEFMGARNDDRPTQLVFRLENGSAHTLPIKLTSLFEKGDPTKTVDSEKAFALHVVDEKLESFRPNPDVLHVKDGDTSFIDATGRKIEGTVEGATFDERGRAIPLRSSFSFDPSATSGERVLLASEIRNYQARTAVRTYWDPSTQALSSVHVTFVEKDGKLEAREDSAHLIGGVKGVQLGKELKGGDDAAAKLAILEEAARTGKRFVVDSDTGEQVWNGAANDVKLKTEWRSADGRWERIDVVLNARFGNGKTGTFLRELDAQGRQVAVHEHKPVVDFFWTSHPRVTPLILMTDRASPTGTRLLVNEDMRSRGMLQGPHDEAGIQALRDLTDLVYLGFESKDGKPKFTIVHDGKRLVYDDEATWKADVERLEALRGR